MSCSMNPSGHHEGGVGDLTTRASSSSTHPSKQNYEVFLSFRGGDTRLGFTDHLYHGLDNRGIEVFIDSEELRVGEKIDQLFEAIKTSKISIPIISPDYASSIWCLKELLQILECKEKSGQLVLPIFYHVKPSDVREQKGDFGKKFLQCKRDRGLDGKFVGELEKAFKEIAELKGWESDEFAEGREGELVEAVATRIFKELSKAVLIVPDFLVGVEDHVKEIKRMIDTRPSNEAKIIAIHGMGGSGKTTLAKVLYNKFSNDFKCQSFVPNIREVSKQKGMEALQKQMISDILMDRSPPEIPHVDKGRSIIDKRFKGKRLLLLLDDVEDKDQLNKLVVRKNFFEPNSIVIITTRNKDVIAAPSAVNLSYELNELNKDQSYELFCKHAFGRDESCPGGLETIARNIISTTGGLPLAVEVIGSLLYKKDEGIWKETLEKLRRIPNEEVREKLKISYDCLGHEQKQMFLDVACLEIGRHKIESDFYPSELEFASWMWDGYGYYPRGGIERLKSLSLIKIDEFGRIIMHDQIRDLGRDIVREEGLGNIGRCSRLWLPKEAREVIETKQGTPNVQALVLRPSLDDLKPIQYGSQHFEGMIDLRFLQMDEVHLTGDFGNHFVNLRWLYWGVRRYYGSPESDIMGINFNPKKLVYLHLNNSNITEHWEGWNQMKDLKFLELGNCKSLTRTPDFSVMKELKVLILRGYTKLREIHLSIGELCNLEILEISGASIECLPTSITMLTKLLKLDLSGCEELKSLPSLPSSLTELYFNGTSMDALPDFSYLTNLKDLTYTDFSKECNKALNLENLNQLQCLHVGGRSYFHQSDMVPGNISFVLPVNLEILEISDCHTLRTLPNLSNLKILSQLFLHRCSKLTEIHGLEGAESLAILEITTCKGLTRLGDLSHLKMLRMLFLFECEMLSDVQGIDKLTSLTRLGLIRCLPKIKFQDLSMLRNLETLHIQDEMLIEIPGLQELKSLKFLYIDQCKSLQYLPDLSQLTNLYSVCAQGCAQLVAIQGIENLQSLRILDIRGCTKLRNLPRPPGVDVEFDPLEEETNGEVL